MSLTILSHEILLSIGNYLTLVDSICFTCTCRKLHDLTIDLVHNQPDWNCDHLLYRIKYITDPRVSKNFKHRFNYTLDKQHPYHIANKHIRTIYTYLRGDTPFSLLIYSLYRRIDTSLYKNNKNLIEFFDKRQINYTLLFACKYRPDFVKLVLKRKPTNLNQALILASDLCHWEYSNVSCDCDFWRTIIYKGLDLVKLLIQAGATNIKQALSYCGCDTLNRFHIDNLLIDACFWTRTNAVGTNYYNSDDNLKLVNRCGKVKNPPNDCGCENLCDNTGECFRRLNNCNCTYKHIVKCDPFTCECKHNKVMQYLRSLLKDDKYIAIY